MNAPSAKLKTPEKLEVPMTKVQRSSNFQIPNSGERGSFDGWNLGFGIYLEFGTWDLELYLPLFFEDTTEITKNYEHHSTNSFRTGLFAGLLLGIRKIVAASEYDQTIEK